MVSMIAWQVVNYDAMPTLNTREKVAVCSDPNHLTRPAVSDGLSIVP